MQTYRLRGGGGGASAPSQPYESVPMEEGTHTPVPPTPSPSSPSWLSRFGTGTFDAAGGLIKRVALWVAGVVVVLLVIAVVMVVLLRTTPFGNSILSMGQSAIVSQVASALDDTTTSLIFRYRWVSPPDTTWVPNAPPSTWRGWIDIRSSGYVRYAVTNTTLALGNLFLFTQATPDDYVLVYALGAPPTGEVSDAGAWVGSVLAAYLGGATLYVGALTPGVAGFVSGNRVSPASLAADLVISSALAR